LVILIKVASGSLFSDPTGTAGNNKKRDATRIGKMSISQVQEIAFNPSLEMHTDSLREANMQLIVFTFIICLHAP
jgi:ribosomal protein L11